MPNDFVDLGYLSRDLWSPDAGSASYVGISVTNGQAHIEDQYNRIKSALEAENSGQNWEVGRLFYMFEDGERFLGWVIKHLNAGSPTGREWLMLFPGNDTSLNLSNITSFMSWTAGASDTVHPANWYVPNIVEFAVDQQVDDGGYTNGTVVMHYHSGGLEAASARAVYELVGQPADGETVEIDGKTYTFEAALTDVDGNVQIGGDAEESRDNLLAAINLDAETRVGADGPGSAYAASMTLHPTVEAEAYYYRTSGSTFQLRQYGEDDYLFVRAKTGGVAGNSISISTTVDNGSWGGKTTLEAGAATNSYGVGSGADFDPPEFIPREYDVTLFFPDFGAKPYPRGGGWQLPSSGRGANKMLCIWNHEVPFVGLYAGIRMASGISRIVLAGDIIEPRVSADPYPEGFFSWWADTVGWNSGQTLVDPGIDQEAKFVHHLTENGFQDHTENASTGGFNMALHNEFDSRNQPRADGTWDLDPIKLYGAYEVKGYLRKDVVGQQGLYQGPQHMLFDARYGKAIQIDYRTVVPWVDDAPVPFYGWPLDPQPFYSD